MAKRRGDLAARRAALGFTQESFAHALGVEMSTVGRWERGELTPQPWRRTKLAGALGVGLDELGELLVSTTSADVVDDARCPAEVSDVDCARLGMAVTDPGRYCDGAVLNQFRTQLDQCMAADGEFGPVQVLPVVVDLVATVRRCADEAPIGLARGLLSLAASGAEFAGWLCRDAEDRTRAEYWYDRATEWAQEADDRPMQGYVLLKKSQMAYDARDDGRVRSLAQAALEGPWQLPSRLRAEAVQQHALGLAVGGEPVGVVERRLDEAYELLTRSSDPGCAGEPGAHFTETTLRVRRAISFTEAGQPGRAAGLLEPALAEADLSRRDAGFFAARRAAALALSGEPDEAAIVGERSAQIAAATDSRRTLHVLEQVLRTLEPWRNRPRVRELRDALAAQR